MELSLLYQQLKYQHLGKKVWAVTESGKVRPYYLSSVKFDQDEVCYYLASVKYGADVLMTNKIFESEVEALDFARLQKKVSKGEFYVIKSAGAYSPSQDEAEAAEEEYAEQTNEI
ncbi:MAG TPA: hypothetical protein VHO28_16310 [Ignavibacteriales bacterium]|nr:hypothetical protein [Ignavibacteriales bacterium]